MNTTTTDKRFATLQAQYAMTGHTLHQSNNSEEHAPASYMAVRWGLVRYLPTLEDAERFLIQIGGAHV